MSEVTLKLKAIVEYCKYRSTQVFISHFEGDRITLTSTDYAMVWWFAVPAFKAEFPQYFVGGQAPLVSFIEDLIQGRLTLDVPLPEEALRRPRWERDLESE